MLRTSDKPTFFGDVAGQPCTFKGRPAKIVTAYDGDKRWPHVVTLDGDVDVQYSFSAVERILASGGRF